MRMTISEPKLEYRRAQAYVAVRSQVTMEQMAETLPPLNREVLQWLAGKGIKPSGPPFWRYLLIDMKRTLEIDVAFPVRALPTGDARITADVLPEGNYATAMFVGHPMGLMQATADLLSWAEQQGIEWKMDGERWSGRVEWYLSDPADEPDMSKWKTELAFLTRR
jgi:effector-binding domain-containing protein